jgi:hypothetical protein
MDRRTIAMGEILEALRRFLWCTLTCSKEPQEKLW